MRRKRTKMMSTMTKMPVKSAMEAKWMGMGPAWKVSGER
jgi:hypothetical protein